MPTKKEIVEKINEMKEFVKNFNNYERSYEVKSTDYFLNRLDEDTVKIMTSGEVGKKVYEYYNNPDLYVEDKLKYYNYREQLKYLATNVFKNNPFGHKFSYYNEDDLDTLYEYLEHNQEFIIQDDLEDEFLETLENKTKNNLYENEFEDELEKMEDLDEYDYDKVLEIKDALKVRNADYSNNLESLETPVEKSTYLYSAKKIDELVEEKKEYKNSINTNYASREYKSGVNSDVTSEIFKNYSYKISDKNKEAIKNIINMLDKYHFLDDLGNGGEEAEKVYALKKIKNKRLEIIDSVKNKDLNGAYNKTQEYQEYIKNMKDVYEYARTVLPQDGSHVPGNVSCLRTNYLPEELVTDVQVHSQVNGIYNFVAYCKSKNYDPIDFLNDPQKYRNKIKEDTYNEFLNRHSANKVTDQKEKGKIFSSATQRIPNATQGENRAFETILCFETDPEIVKNNSISKIANFDFGSYFGVYPGCFLFQKGNEFDVKPDYEQIRNYIAAGEFYDIQNFVPDGMNPVTGEKFTSTFNYNDFLNSDNISTIEKFNSVMDRLSSGLYQSSVELINGEYNNSPIVDYGTFLACTKAYFSDLLAVENKKENPDKTAVDFLNNFLINPFYSLQKYTENKFKYELENSVDGIDELSNISNNADYKNALKALTLPIDPEFNNVIENPLNEAIVSSTNKSSKELKEQFNQYLDKTDYVKFSKEYNMDIMAIGYEVNDRYNSKNIFQRWLTPDGWRERSIINNLKKAFEKKGIDEKTYDDIFLAADDYKKEAIVKGTALLNYKENIDKFNNLKNEINNAKEFKESIKDIKKIDAFINMGLAKEDDIEKLKTIKKESIDLLVEKGVNKEELYNSFGLKLEKKSLFKNEKEFSGDTKVTEVSKEIKKDDLNISKDDNEIRIEQ